MARPAKFTHEQILDAALAEIAEAGIDGASVAAMGRRLGAPNGSIYHRFPSRHHLLGALWVATADSYRQALFQALDTTDHATLPRRIVDHTFDWVEENPARAELLMRLRTEDFTPWDWPDSTVADITSTNLELVTEIARFAHVIGINPINAVMAIIDVPAAAARRSLLLGDPTATILLRQLAIELVTTLVTTTS